MSPNIYDVVSFKASVQVLIEQCNDANVTLFNNIRTFNGLTPDATMILPFEEGDSKPIPIKNIILYYKKICIKNLKFKIMLTNALNKTLTQSHYDSYLETHTEHFELKLETFGTEHLKKWGIIAMKEQDVAKNIFNFWMKMQ